MQANKNVRRFLFCEMKVIKQAHEIKQVCSHVRTRSKSISIEFMAHFELIPLKILILVRV